MKKYLVRDWIISIVLTLSMLLFVGMQLTRGSSSWGDDFAAYITEGISISDNRFDEQIKLNHFLHPSPMPEEAADGELVYVWGYPLFLSIVHRIAGFDTINYTSVIYYKIPSLIAFSLTIGVLYLLYRRYFSCGTSLLLVLFFAVSGNFVDTINMMYSDIVFLFFSTLSIWLNECFLDGFRNKAKTGTQLLLSLLLAIAMWLCYETRFNGQTIVILAAVATAIMLFENRSTLKKREVIISLLPYALFFLMKWISEAVLAPATSNLSDLGNGSTSTILKNILFYGKVTCGYLGMGDTGVGLWAGFFFCLLLIAGFFKDGFKSKNLPLSILIVGTYVVLILLPYQQGLRYIYNILPFLILYVALGARFLFSVIKERGKTKNVLKFAAGAAAALFLIFVYSAKVSDGVENIRNHRQGKTTDVYSSYAIEAYRFIQEQTSEDEKIIFFKPRALYLNTGRISFVPDMNGHEFEEADYFLHYKHGTGMQKRIIDKHSDDLVCIFQNQKFTLYKISK